MDIIIPGGEILEVSQKVYSSQCKSSMIFFLNLQVVYFSECIWKYPYDPEIEIKIQKPDEN